MTLTGGLRRAALTVHVISSVGWLGAVLAFLVVAVTGLTSADGGLVRAAALLMAALGQTVIVPLSLLALASGVLQALGTRWGLLDHSWVVIKLIITAVSVLVLLTFQPGLNALADQAAGWPSPTPAQVAQLRSPAAALHAGGALVGLVTATALSVLKPAGVTPAGQRRQRRAARRS
ncbi:hypothetical protein GCM10008956_37260 [Deinococcus arenae]|uniref:DUF2269 domain-containing protein n=1 Tax=Deinococcus arenae TaxID=1452751 RepID=A0A8H9LAE2_9DEIO|nr:MULTISPECIES: hypothetical protein [Deinococcus]GGM58226.1 hypothetical protein GCM10008956_37260 [Deinococcus arenae]